MIRLAGAYDDDGKPDEAIADAGSRAGHAQPASRVCKPFATREKARAEAIKNKK